MYSIVLQLSLTSKDICLTLVQRASDKHSDIVETLTYYRFWNPYILGIIVEPVLLYLLLNIILILKKVAWSLPTPGP